MSGNLDSQAQYFLEEIFGKNHKYEVVDGHYGDSMDVWVEGAKDYEVKELHIEIAEWHNKEGSQEVVSFRVIRAESNFPSIEGEADEEGEWEEKLSESFDCSFGELCMELATLAKEHGDDYIEWSFESDDEGGSRVWLDITPLPLEELDKSTIPSVDEINDFLKELKETIDSHKKKTAKKDS